MVDWKNEHWSRQKPGSISLPEFIQKRAKGEAAMFKGRVYLKKPGPDPELQALLHSRINTAAKVMAKNIVKTLYGNKS